MTRFSGQPNATWLTQEGAEFERQASPAYRLAKALLLRASGVQ